MMKERFYKSETEREGLASYQVVRTVEKSVRSSVILNFSTRTQSPEGKNINVGTQTYTSDKGSLYKTSGQRIEQIFQVLKQSHFSESVEVSYRLKYHGWWATFSGQSCSVWSLKKFHHHFYDILVHYF